MIAINLFNEILSKKIPPAVDEVRKLVAEDLAALNTLMLEAKIPYIQVPAFTGGGFCNPDSP